MSRINYGEVLYISRKALGLRGGDLGDLLDLFDNVPITVLSATDERVDAATDLKSRCSISYADAFACGLAIEKGFALMTGDRDFHQLEKDRILWLHRMGA